MQEVSEIESILGLNANGHQRFNTSGRVRLLLESSPSKETEFKVKCIRYSALSAVGKVH